MIIIIGGGVFGLAIGWHIARSGHQVSIIEQGQVGHGATWAAAGMLMPWRLSASFNEDLFNLQQESYQYWPTFADELTQEPDISIDYLTSGRYFIATTPKAVERLRWQFQFHQNIGFSLQFLEGDAVQQQGAKLGPNVLAAIFTPMAQQVDNRRLVIALRNSFIKAGGTLLEETQVHGVVIEQNQVVGVRLPNELLKTDTIVLAAGAWSGQLVDWADKPTDVVRPLKGQTLILQMNPNKPLLTHQIVGPCYFVPRGDGRLVIGSTFDREDDFDTRPTIKGIYRILNKALEIIPDIMPLPILEISSGLRPTAPDRVPVIGTTAVQGLTIATGGHSHGILLSPIIAQTVSDLVLTGKTSHLIKPFEPTAST